MEEEKAVAYYDELTRRGEGAARFKQGLGFSSGDSVSRGSAIAFSSDSSSFLNTFVKASSPTKAAKYEKEAQLQSIQNKLSKKKNKDDEDEREKSSRVYRERDHSRRSRSRERDRGREYRRRSRSRSRERYRDKRRERRSRSGSPRPERRSERRRSRSRSPRESRRSEKGKERNGGADYSKLIQGYDTMTPAERVKARMKLQLKETAGKDKTKGMGSGWERFEFDKDAPLDDEELEAAEDDVALVKHIGQSFRFSALEVRREEQIKAAHDEAMFGAPALLTPVSPADEPKVDNEKEHNESEFTTSLLSEKVLAKQQGSWRDRVRKV